MLGELAALPANLLALMQAPARQVAPAERPTFPPASPVVLDRARAALKRHGPAIEGQGGEKHTFVAACVLRNDFALANEQAWPLLLEWNETCEPPWDPWELATKLDGGAKYASKPYGCERERAELPCIHLTADEHIAFDAAAEALAKHPKIYRQGPRIVKVNSGPPATLDGLGPAEVRHDLTQVATFEKSTEKGIRRATPTEPMIAYCLAPNTVPARPIVTLLEAPSIRPDGSVLVQPGYDADTSSFLVDSVEVPAIADHPTREVATKALEVLKYLLGDFPFETPVDRSALLAFVLTMFIRTAIDGPMPLCLVDSNVRGAGKSLLADLVSIIATGRVAERVTFPVGNEEEQRKLITALLQDGKQIVLFDNVAGSFGGAPLDQLMTSQLWVDRRLGVTQTIRLANRTVWFATSNNAQLVGDLHRRSVFVRLVSQEARPEDRAGFRISDVKGFARTYRGRLIKAALTILRAYHLAGRPSMGLKAFGSFESWSALVRAPLVWLGEPDPISRSQEFASVADTQQSVLERLVAGLDLVTSGQFMSVGEILSALERDWDQHREFKAVLVDACPVRGGDRLPTSQAVGRLFAKYRQRQTADGRCLEMQINTHTKSGTWRVAGMRGSAGFVPTGSGKNEN